MIGVGTWQLGGEWGKEFEQGEVDAILARAAELGINLIDTAECYGDHLAERLIGKAIQGRRENWISPPSSATVQRGRSSGTMCTSRPRCRSNWSILEALQTDYIDLYQFHSGTDAMFDTPGLWETLRRLVEAGSHPAPGHLCQQQERQHLPGGPGRPPVGAEAIQVVYNRIERKPSRSCCRRACDRTSACWRGCRWPADS